MSRQFWLGIAGGLLAAVAFSQVSLTPTVQAHSADKAEASMLYELRTYTTPDGKLDALHARFRDHTMKLFEKHGMKNIMYWTPVDQPNTLIYVIAHKDKAAADASWQGFRNDPEWKRVAEESQRDGRLVSKVESVYMNQTDYSPKH